MLTLSEMFTPLDKDTILSSMLSVAQSLGFPITAWQSGSVPREILEVIAQKIADFTTTTSAIASGGLLDYATGGWLTLLARSLYGLTRTPATFGTTTESLSNSSGVAYVINAGDLHFLNGSTGATYTNTTGGTLGASGGTLDVQIIADQSGTSFNATASAINSLVTPLLGVTMSNASPLTANDEETDEELRERCRESLAAASPNGPGDAYDFFAKAATRLSDGSNVGVTRTLVVSAGNGSTTVYVASATGAIAGTMGNPATDLGAIHDEIQKNCVPTGFAETTVSAVAHNILVSATVYLKHGSTLAPSVAQDQILVQLQNYFKTIPIGGFDIGSGGKVFVDALIGQIYQASGEFIEVTISSPGGASVALAQNEVAVITSVGANFTITST